MNIYISNLSYNTDDAGLRDLFAEYGDISSAKVITDRDTGRSRGFGFVEMPDDAQAQQAIDGLNEKEFDGKVINVAIAKPRTEKRDFNNNRRDGGGYNSRRY